VTPEGSNALLAQMRALEVMPNISAIALPLISALQAPSDAVDVDRVVELVSYDAALAAQCLRMSNSPLFGRRKTERVRDAVVALGLKRIESIVMGSCLSGVLPEKAWVLDAVTFWRHCLGCALVSSRVAKLIGYVDPEKAYLAGLLHDVGILVNTLVCEEGFRACVEKARQERLALQLAEQQCLGFTHAQSGKILAEQWHFSQDVTEVIEFHHDVLAAAPSARTLVAVVHLGDLFCRLRNLGYGYFEATGVDFSTEDAWTTLVETCPTLRNLDLARFSMDIDGAMEEIVAVADSVFKPVSCRAG
jgi:putative nucleotidyltransferase with HDIG domain